MKFGSMTAIAVAAALAACSATQSIPDVQIKGFTQSKPTTLSAHFEKLYVEGEHNAVLNLNALAQAALSIGEFAVAEKALDKAIARIDSVYADNESAKTARSLWAKESNKDFKGEPYERALTYYYRGLLYLREGDYQNARAMFLAADFQDTVAEQEEFQSDFGLMPWLAAWASHCDGDAVRANELYTRALEANRARWSGRSPDINWLLLVESGSGPVKTLAGKHKEKLVIEKPASTTQAPTIARLDGVTATDPGLSLAGDVIYQATTRGGRAFQEILDGKAAFKDSSEALGMHSTLMSQQAINNASYTNNRDMANIGGLFAIVGLVSTIASISTKPEADNRAWTQVPGAIHLTKGRLVDAVTRADVLVSYRASDGQSRNVTPAFSTNGRGCGLAYVMAREPESLAPGRVKAATLEREEADNKFRAELERDFGSAVIRSAKL
ncbi:MAG: hypothetical protein R3E87_22180 [Burkholderiaceae bacterium]